MDRRKSILPSVVLAAGLLLAAFAFYLWLTGRSLRLTPTDKIALSGRSTDPMVGRPAPDFELGTPDGSKLKLSQYRGHPVLVNYWATWCPPCREEMPLFQRSHEKYPDLVVLAVDGGEDPEVVAKFIDEIGVTFAVLLDRDYKVESLLGVIGYPTTVFIDSDGIIQARQIGQLDSRLLDAYLKVIGVGR